jgi:tRNA pseudouridine55 synthase
VLQAAAVQPEFHGVIVVDKPAGMTSAAVVAEARRQLGVRRIGHTGTLDPMATGVLPLCVGEGTKLAAHLLAEDKEYEGELELGTETDTLDAEGQVTRVERAAAAGIDRVALAQGMAAFEGPGAQVPPMFSAVKHRGRRLHELARAGEVVERVARPILVHHFALAAGPARDLRARFTVHCSKGTYVRSLVSDLGRRLGCGAHLTALRRVRAGAFGIDQAVPLSELGQRGPAQLIDPARAVAHLPAAVVPAALLGAVRDGRRLPWQQISGAPAPAGAVRLLTPAGQLLSLAEVVGGRLHHQRVFAYGLTNGTVSSNLCRSKAAQHDCVRPRRSDV